MYYSYSLLALAAVSSVSAHGVLQSITGANGVTMPGLSIADGTPRDCATPSCGAEKDTTVFQGDNPLGKTNGYGTVNPETNVAIFMGTASAPAAGSSSSESSESGATGGGLTGLARSVRRGLFGGSSSSSSSSSSGTDATGTKTASGTVEDIVSKTAGQGATSGLPTADEDGTLTMNLHQVNQDGAGAFSAGIDSTSGGTSEAAFEDAQVTQNVGGFGPGLSGVTTTDFPVKVAVPAGTVCSGTIGSAKNVCVVRMMNTALAGPFGGSAAFTQTSAQRKRALEYRRRMRTRREFTA